jgi:hypothetical protein
MELLTILAQAAETATREAARGAAHEAAGEGTVPAISTISTILNFIWEHVTSLGPVEALTFISFGVVWLFYGWRVFKILVTICFALGGLLLGIWANNALIHGNVIWLSALFAALLAIMSIPLMRWGVTLLGAAAGGVLTAGGWIALRLPEQYIWAGAIIGIIAGAMISFIVFKIAVMLFTSLGGSALMVVGVLAILYKYMGAAERLQDLFFNKKWFLPLMLLTPIVIGIILQYRFIKGAKDWSV